MTAPRGLWSNIRAAFGGDFVQVPLSLIIFVGLAWRLSEVDFGLWVAVTTTAMIIGTFANLGSQEILMREIARGRTFAGEWGTMLTSQALGAAAGMLIALLARQVFFPQVALTTALLLMPINLYLFWAIEGSVRAGMALRRLHLGARARLTFAVGRAAGVGVFVLSGSDDLDTYARIAFPFALVSAGLGVGLIGRATKTRPRFHRPERWRVVEGLPFVVSAGATDMLASFDRPLMTSYGLVAETGSYGIADRAIRLSTLPTLAVARATSQDFFETGHSEPSETYRLAQRYVKPTTAYGVFVMLVIWLLVATLGGLVPERFELVPTMLAWLAPIPVAHALQMFSGNVLTGTDRQPLRMWIFVGAALLNVGLNIVLIPTVGWEGAAMATLVAEFAAAAAMWVAAGRVAKLPAPVVSR